MEIIIILIVSAVASLLTLFSGFGLGTILTPVYAIFFPIDIAIALTGIVHFLNNIFKLILIGKNASWNTVLKFGIPSLLGAFLGAMLLMELDELAPILTYQIGNKSFTITPIKLIIGILLIIFAFLEFLPFLKDVRINNKSIFPGGLASGFFGGLSGNQGALRSAFLIKLNLNKTQFIATGVVISMFVDITRLSVYMSTFVSTGVSENISTIVASTLSAFAGAFVGSRLIEKITYKFVQIVVTIMVVTLSVFLCAGIV